MASCCDLKPNESSTCDEKQTEQLILCKFCTGFFLIILHDRIDNSQGTEF
jgi:hypothetical protein